MSKKYYNRSNLDLDLADTFNMNIAYLANINTLIKSYFLYHFDDNFEGMYKSLISLELLISPKIDNDDIEKKLEWLEENKEKWSIKDLNGNVIRINYQYKRILNKEFNECFRLILIKIENKGMLTHMPDDPKRAMAKFDA